MSTARRIRPASSAAVRDAIEGAKAAGISVGRVEVAGKVIRIYAVDDARRDSDADDVERRMREAFEGDDD